MSSSDHFESSTPIYSASQGNEFADRLKMEHEFLKFASEVWEPWSRDTGYYRDDDHALVNQLSLPQRTENRVKELELNPPTFPDYLSIVLKDLRAVEPINKPTIALDIGGGAGATWCEEAPKFADDIKKGRIAFVVSNLVWGPEQFREQSRRRDDLTIDGIQHQPELVHFVNSTFRQLCRQSITLPNGETVPLRGNVDLVHESRSLTSWSHVPEIDVLSVIGLLSKRGYYCISPQRTQYQYRSFPEADGRANSAARRTAVLKVQAELSTKYGLLQIPKVEEGNYQGAELLYKMFKKPAAPPVRI